MQFVIVFVLPVQTKIFVDGINYFKTTIFSAFVKPETVG